MIESEKFKQNLISKSMTIDMEVIRFSIDEHGNQDMFVRIPVGFDARWDKIPLKKGDTVHIKGCAWKGY